MFDSDWTELTTAKSTFEAERIVGALKGMDVEARTVGDQLTDEYAMSQQLMGAGICVMVRATELERARQALHRLESIRPTEAELEEALEKASVEAEPEQPEAKTDAGVRRPTLALVLLSAAALWLGLLWLGAKHDLEALERSDPNFKWHWTGSGYDIRWTHNGQRAALQVDDDADGTEEEVWRYNREGRPVSRSIDKDENGIFEMTIDLDQDGHEKVRWIDANENGLYERLEYPAHQGVQERWIDADEDGRFERYEFVQVNSGSIERAYERADGEGYLQVK